MLPSNDKGLLFAKENCKDFTQDGANLVETLCVDPVFFSNDKLYIKLAKTGPGDNFSSYKVPANKPWDPNDFDVFTTWSALQFDHQTMMINIGDFTFAKSNAFGCSNTMDAKARIDLRGTPFAIDDQFASGGYMPKGQIVFSCSNQVVDILEGGYCGWTVPKLANDAGEMNAAQGGNYLKIKFLDCLNDSVSVNDGGGFYIKLKYENYSHYKQPTRKPWSQDDTDVKTIWTKIRFDPSTWLVHTGDFSYTMSTGYCSHHKQNNPDRIPFGSAFGCESPFSQDGLARIDLRGTPFAIDDDFSHGGYESNGTASFSNDRQVVEIRGGGYCGWMVPTKAKQEGEVKSHIGGWYLKLKPI